jgi:histone H3/H4
MKPRTVYNEIKRNFPEARVSPDACEEIASYLRIQCQKIAARAFNLAKHAKRETITIDDVRMVLMEKGEAIE